ncbi:FkbM family methyltransferase [Priestia aryabhattai]|uniref:FkbM family methyltransferase n=1 Tax=Priestia aryabhattai TaxID=412384 RepID=UPI0037367DE8
MDNESTQMERNLKMSFIKDTNNLEILMELGEIYYSNSQLELAKECFLRSLIICQNLHQKEIIDKKLLLIEQDIQIQQYNTIQPIHNDFLDLLIKELFENAFNNYYYNIDLELFQMMSVPFSIDSIVVNTEEEIREISTHLQGISRLYYSLEDQKSQNLLIKLLSFRLLGNKKVKLPLNTINYWNKRKSIRDLVISNEKIITKYHKWNLQLFDLSKIKFDIKLFCIPIGVSATFIDKQYEYNGDSSVIKVEEGDVVIDAGGCFGDTALYFAHEIGPKGHVYTIEFIPSNLEIMDKNFSMNPNLQQQITIVKNPLWDTSNKSIYYKDQGPGSFVTFHETMALNEKTLTISIDDLVHEKHINKVNFIKMDIEGAELNALKGAIKVIKKFKPTLAIAIYHQVKDFSNIIQFISSLELGYKFYLGHYTIYALETILFAVPERKEE